MQRIQRPVEVLRGNTVQFRKIPPCHRQKALPERKTASQNVLLESGLGLVNRKRRGHCQCRTIQIRAHILPVDGVAAFMERRESRTGKVILKVPAGETDVLAEVEGGVGVCSLVHTASVEVVSYSLQYLAAEGLLLFYGKKSSHGRLVWLGLGLQPLNKRHEKCLQLPIEPVDLLAGCACFPFVHESGHRICGKSGAADQLLLIGKLLLQPGQNHRKIILRSRFCPDMLGLQIVVCICGIEFFRHF